MKTLLIKLRLHISYLSFEITRYRGGSRWGGPPKIGKKYDFLA
jgi:hypothetical protein